MPQNFKLTTVAACHIAGIERDRFNEHVATGRFKGAPSTTPGRGRLFDPADMIGLCLFCDLMDDGFDTAHAGKIADAVQNGARLHPEASAIAHVDFFMGSAIATPASEVPAPNEWPTAGFAGRAIRKVTVFNIGQMRKRIAERTEYERSIIGERA